MSDDGLRDALRKAGDKPLRDSLERSQRMARRRNGEVTFRSWQGPWSEQTRYRTGDVVSHEGSSWRALSDNAASEPPSDAWEYVAKRGEKGEKGEKGTAGIGSPGAPGAPQTPASTVVTETAFGQAPAVGTGLDYARGDHTHGTPDAQTVPDPATTVTDETTFGITPAVGIATDFARGDHTHGSPAAPSVPDPAATVVTETSFGQAPAVGVGTDFARDDHTHGTPTAPSVPTAGDTVVTETSYGQASGAGTDPDFSREDHTHGTPAVPAHDDLSSVTSDQHHAQSHAHNGADGSGTVAHSATTGQTADDHHDESHAARHAENGADELDVAALGSGAATAGQVPTADGAGGVDWDDPAALGGSAAVVDRIATSEATNSITYTDLATIGPTVSIAVGSEGKLVVGVTAGIIFEMIVSFELFNLDTSSVTIAPNDNRSIGAVVGGETVIPALEVGKEFLLTGLAPGNYRVRAKYRVIIP